MGKTIYNLHNQNITILKSYFFFILLFSFSQVIAQDDCEEEVLLSDRFTGLYHGGALQTEDGKFYAWGENITPGGAFLEVKEGTFGLPQGVSPVKISGGSNGQLEGGTSEGNAIVILASDNRIYRKGIANIVLHNVNSIALPTGVQASQVTSFYAGYATIAIVANGKGYVWSLVANKVYGDGATNKAKRWGNPVQDKDGNVINDFVQIRADYGSDGQGFIGFTKQNKLYVWGRDISVPGGNLTSNTYNKAQLAKLPANMTGNIILVQTNKSDEYRQDSSVESSWYFLTDTYELWASGSNLRMQLGDFTENDRKNFVRVLKKKGEPAEVVYFSTEEHDATHIENVASVMMVLKDNSLYGFGNHGEFGVLGTGQAGSNGSTKFPTIARVANGPTGKIDGIHHGAKFVEIGGHITFVVKTDDSVCAAGHGTNGSLLGSSVNKADFSTCTDFKFPSVSISTDVQNQEVCEGETATFTATTQVENASSISYEWFVSTDNGVNWTTTNVTGTQQVGTPVQLELTNISIALNQNQYKLLVYLGGDKCLGDESVGILTVKAAPKIDDRTICVGETIDLGENGNYQSSDTSIATVNNNGQVTGIKAGKATITSTNANNCTDTAVITVSATGACLPSFVVAQNDIHQVNNGLSIIGNVLTNDYDLENRTISLVEFKGKNASGGFVNISTNKTALTSVYDDFGTLAGEVYYLPSNGFFYFKAKPMFVGFVHLTYKIRNSEGDFGEATVRIKVLDVYKKTTPNSPPKNNAVIAHNDTGTTLVNAPTNLVLFPLKNDSDVDDDPILLTNLFVYNEAGVQTTHRTLAPYSVYTKNKVLAGKMQHNTSNGSIEFTPENDFSGKVTVEYEITDGKTTDRAKITIEVLNYENNTTFANDDAIVRERGQIFQGNVLANDSDTENHNSVVTEVFVFNQAIPVGTQTQINEGSLKVSANGDFLFIPKGYWLDTVAVIYEKCDNQNPRACAKATLYITPQIQPRILPVFVKSFQAKRKKENSAEINWQIESNENKKATITLERSYDGVIFSELLTTNQFNSSYCDENAKSIHSAIYYRLKIETNDGQVLYSSIEKVQKTEDKNNHYQLYPNPVQQNSTFTVVSQEPIQSIEVYDLSGKLFIKKEFADNKKVIEISTNNFSKSMYNVVINQSTTMKLIVQ